MTQPPPSANTTATTTGPYTDTKFQLGPPPTVIHSFDRHTPKLLSHPSFISNPPRRISAGSTLEYYRTTHHTIHAHTKTEPQHAVHPIKQAPPHHTNSQPLRHPQ
ncbi:hypothetical protein KC19_11G147400 [Ceratodon purpureus]|uniref:Uncharacterized protein n=1 Tax=Ceratodon purpureus TaxID=3225 RepID=A0A8T0GHK4_CERPU|nr:hypothetical protein KC19_11G147400 [Ceratodon purpureus]